MFRCIRLLFKKRENETKNRCMVCNRTLKSSKKLVCDLEYCNENDYSEISSMDQ